LSNQQKTSLQILAFDFGSKHIGIATGQSLGETAQALCQIPANNGIPDWQQLDAIMEEWRPKLLVVGNPLNMDGSQSEMSLRAKKFSNRLKDRYHLPCALVDERLSSFEAKQTQSIKDGEIDSQAAAIILRSWYDSRA